MRGREVLNDDRLPRTDRAALREDIDRICMPMSGLARSAC
jgi:hypothetical protein